MRRINVDKAHAAALYVETSKSGDDPADILAMLEDPEIVFTTVPENTMAYASFMHRVGALKNRPQSWKDYFFPEAHPGDGG
jgi:NitT/TauT family transport system substrate-binding protein